MPYSPYLLQAIDDHVPNRTYLQKLQNVKHLAPGKVRPALSLVGYPDEAAEAIALVFNYTLDGDMHKLSGSGSTGVACCGGACQRCVEGA